MTLEPDHGFGLLTPEDQEKLECILNERGAYGVPDLHGMLTASVVGPKPIPLNWIVQTVLSVPDSETNGFNHFPEFSWAKEKIGELLFRINKVFQQDSEMFRLLVYQPNLEEGDDTPEPRSWCFGFVEAMMYHREDWEPLFSMDFLSVAPIVITGDPNGWVEKDDLNPFKQMSSAELCEGIQLATRAIHAFWPVYTEYRAPIRAAVVPSRNAPCSCGSGRKFKRCCGRSV
jgi:yecA family protein